MEPPATNLTVDDLAEAKGLDPTFLRSLGVTDGVYGVKRQKCVDIPYPDAKGQVTGVHKRLRLAGEPRFVWQELCPL